MIEFPNLGGIKFEISNVAFRIPVFGGIDIYWYGIIIALAFAVAVILGMRSSKKFGIDPENIIDLVLFAVPVSIIFARLYYVVFSWSQFKDNLWSIFNTRLGGLAIYGGVIGALLTAYFFARYKKMSFLKLLDFCIPYMVLAQSIGRWGNFINQEAYGTHTSLPWGMDGDKIINGPVHPTFLYESLWNLGLFFFLIWFRKRKKVKGEVFFLYMILYGAGRFWIEPLRTDSLMLGPLRISQVLALVFVLIFAVIFVMRRKKLSEKIDNNITTGASEYSALLSKIKEEADSEKEAIIDSEKEAIIDSEKEEIVEVEDEKVVESSETVDEEK